MSLPHAKTLSRCLPGFPRKRYGRRLSFSALQLFALFVFAVLLAGFLIPAFLFFQSVSALELGTARIVQALETARDFARQGKDGSLWGVQLPQGVVFQGEHYSLRQSQHDRTFSLPGNVVVDPMEVIFSRYDGMPNWHGDIVVRSDMTGRSRIVRVSELGDISAMATLSTGDLAHADTPPPLRPDDGTSCAVRFSLQDNTITSIGVNDIRFRVLGSHGRYGADGPLLDSYASLRLSGAHTSGWMSLFSGRPIVVGAEEVLRDVPTSTRLDLRFTAHFSWLFRRSYQSNDATPAITAFVRGDVLPASLAQFSMSLQQDLRPFVRADGTLALGENDVLFLVNFHPSRFAALREYDTAMLVSFLPKPRSCRREPFSLSGASFSHSYSPSSPPCSDVPIRLSDGSLFLPQQADVRFVSFATDIPTRARISFDGGSHWQSLFDGGRLHEKDTAIFHRVPAGSTVRLAFSVQSPWIFWRGVPASSLRILSTRELPASFDLSSSIGASGSLVIDDRTFAFLIHRDVSKYRSDFSGTIVLLSIEQASGSLHCAPSSAQLAPLRALSKFPAHSLSFLPKILYSRMY